MRSVMFNFRSSVLPEQQETILATIDRWRSVRKVGHLKPEAKHPLLRRMCFAYVEDNANIEAFIERLGKIPAIETVSIPPMRHLV